MLKTLIAKIQAYIARREVARQHRENDKRGRDLRYTNLD